MHESVLLQETIDGLDLKPGDVLIDGTLGRAGHSIAALAKESSLFIIGIDRDQDALDESKAKLEAAGGVEDKSFKLFLGNFRDMDRFAAEAGKPTVDKIMLDLGLSSPQLDSAGRGMSFRKEEPLYMTMEKDPAKAAFTALDIVNGWEEEDIANVIYAYGDERYARRIAKAIVEAREVQPLKTTADLVDIIGGAVPGFYRKGKIHPATRTFQALRIAVNDELGGIKQALLIAPQILNPGGRLAVISFHSLEDRLVKTAMKEWEKAGIGRSLTKKPMAPTDAEAERNPRSRSAKLRIFIQN